MESKHHGRMRLLTRLSPEALARPESVFQLNQQVEERIKRECPKVKWLANYAVLGACDYLDIFSASHAESAKVSLLVSPLGERVWSSGQQFVYHSSTS